MTNRNGRHQGRDPLPGDPSDPVGLTALLERFLLWMETHHYAPGTVTLRRQILARFILWCLERSVTRPCDVTPLMIERYQRHLFHYRKRNGQPLSLTTQSQALTSLRRWFWWMHRQHHLEHNPASDMQLPRGERRLPRHAMSEGEVEAVLAQADISTPFGLRNRAMLETLYSTGLRREEVLSLQLTDIDRQRSLLLVCCGKGKKDRYVPLGQRALAWIDKYLAEVRPQLQGDAASPALFLTKNGRAMHPNYFSAMVRKYLENAGVAKAGACHLFRHATATLMLENGADVRFIQALLGHESLRTTQIYTHVSITHLREVHERTHPARLSRLQGSEGTEQNGAATAEGG